MTDDWLLIIRKFIKLRKFLIVFTQKTRICTDVRKRTQVNMEYLTNMNIWIARWIVTIHIKDFQFIVW